MLRGLPRSIQEFAFMCSGSLVHYGLDSQDLRSLALDSAMTGSFFSSYSLSLVGMLGGIGYSSKLLATTVAVFVGGATLSQIPALSFIALNLAFQ